MAWIVKLLRSRAPAAVVVVRLLAGSVFFAEGVKKFLFAAEWGAGRFERIGIPHPEILAPFVGAVEIVCGALLVIGLFTRIAAIPLLINIAVAICTTKIPILRAKGFWPMEADARTDYSMLLSLIFLLIVGGGAWALDAGLWKPASKGPPPNEAGM
jgi:putative oxidoreductase